MITRSRRRREKMSYERSPLPYARIPGLRKETGRQNGTKNTPFARRRWGPDRYQRAQTIERWRKETSELDCVSDGGDMVEFELKDGKLNAT